MLYLCLKVSSQLFNDRIVSYLYFCICSRAVEQYHLVSNRVRKSKVLSEGFWDNRMSNDDGPVKSNGNCESEKCLNQQYDKNFETCFLFYLNQDVDEAVSQTSQFNQHRQS